MHAPRMFATAALIAALTLVACAPGAPTPTPSESAATPSPTPSQSGSASPSGGVTEPGAPGTTRAITVDRPGTGDTVDVPFTVSGTADVFEAALTIDAIDESGLTACVRHLTATSGSGTRGTWEGSLAFPPEEDPLRLTLRAYTFSPKDGSMAELVELPITASPERPDIILTNPRCGDVYRPGGLILLTGTAAVFEASFSVDVRDSRRTVLDRARHCRRMLRRVPVLVAADAAARPLRRLLRHRRLQHQRQGRLERERVRRADRSAVREVTSSPSRDGRDRCVLVG